MPLHLSIKRFITVELSHNKAITDQDYFYFLIIKSSAHTYLYLP